MTLTETQARAFVRMTLPNLTRRWPFKLDQVLCGPDDLAEPAAIHPIFHGSFDWHSSVHGHWQVLRLLRLFPAMSETADIRVLADAMLVPEKVAGELARLDRPYGALFERPYGWAWLLALHAEAARHQAPWAEALDPLARRFAAQFSDHLPRLTYPITVGTHFNTAFALVLALEWAGTRDEHLATLIRERALAWFGGRTDYRGWEPGGDEFLSPALTAALLMSRVLDRAAFAAWFANFLPQADSHAPPMLFEPVLVSDRSDGKIAHLDGLNLSRAWCWKSIGAALGEPERFAAVAQRHIAASLPHIGDDYMGAHWLASFALLALEEVPCDK
jgi:hypothetical protein